jgi:hypothetical protein
LAFTDDLRRVTWPCKFRLGITFKYDGTTNPQEFLQVYTTAMEIAEGGHTHVLANWFPLALKVPASDWLLRLPRGSVRSWAHLCEQFINAFQGGYKRPGTLNDLLALSQRPKEMLRSFMQRFCQLAHGVVNTSDGKIIAAFIAGVRDNRCREELGIHEPSTVSKFYALVDECARAEEARLAPEHAAQAANDPVP